MKGITIKDEKDERLAFDLIDILNVLGEDGRSSTWEVSGVECLGSSADRLHSVSDEKRMVSGEQLVTIATDLLQTIEGDFGAFSDDSPMPWLIVRFVDGSVADIETENSSVLDKFRSKFSNIVEIPDGF